MDVQSIARQMRVRADIIRAIENNDFTRMPPRGYAKNMVATYARIVGVNQTTITRMYLEAANAYETGKMKNDSSRVPNMRSQRSSRGSNSRQADDSSRRSSGRLMFDDRHDARGTARSNDHVHTSRRPLSPGSPQYTNLYAAPQNVTQQRPKLPLLIGIGIIAVIVIIICVFVFGGKESQPAQETPTVPSRACRILRTSRRKATPTVPRTQTPKPSSLPSRRRRPPSPTRSRRVRASISRSTKTDQARHPLLRRLQARPRSPSTSRPSCASSPTLRAPLRSPSTGRKST